MPLFKKFIDTKEKSNAKKNHNLNRIFVIVIIKYLNIKIQTFIFAIKTSVTIKTVICIKFEKIFPGRKFLGNPWNHRDLLGDFFAVIS